MPQRLAVLKGAFSTALIAAFISAGGARVEETLGDFAQHSLRDFTATVVVVQKNDAELRGLGKNFAQSYRFRETLIRYKEPQQLRVDAKAGLLSLRYVVNGTRKSTQIPGLHINKVKDITGRPGEAQGMLTFGVLTRAFLENAVASRFAGRRELDGRLVPVFEYWYTADKLSRHHLLWIDPEKKIVLRHDVDDGNGRPWVRYLLKQPIQVAGVWVPTGVEVYTADGRLAAVTRATSVKVNTGLDGSLFRQ